MQGSCCNERSMWNCSHEIHPGHWRTRVHEQCLQGFNYNVSTYDISPNWMFVAVFPGVHDGWVWLHQDQHWQGECQRHPRCWPRHVQSHQRIWREDGIQGWIQTCRRNQVSYKSGFERQFCFLSSLTSSTSNFFLKRKFSHYKLFRTAKDAMNWLILIKEELGNDWLNNNMFRIGASGTVII